MHNIQQHHERWLQTVDDVDIPFLNENQFALWIYEIPQFLDSIYSAHCPHIY